MKYFYFSSSLDYHYGEWRVNKETGLKERLVTYKTVVGGVVGTNSLSCREKQVKLNSFSLKFD